MILQIDSENLVCLTPKDAVDVVKERLSYDLGEYLSDYISELENGIDIEQKRLDSDLISMESTCDAYHDRLYNIRETLDDLIRDYSDKPNMKRALIMNRIYALRGYVEENL